MVDVPKMPSMKHVPWSEEQVRPNKVLDRETASDMFNDKTNIVLEKMDGAQVCLTKQEVYARSHGHKAHGKQFDMLKKQHREQYIHAIPSGYAVFGEWLYAQHSIEYTDLPSYFLVFGFYDVENRRWESWQATKALSYKCGFDHVPEITTVTKGNMYDDQPEGESRYGDTLEGYVIRNRRSFQIDDLTENMAKCVRENHVQTGEFHWQTGTITTNQRREQDD